MKIGIFGSEYQIEKQSVIKRVFNKLAERGAEVTLVSGPVSLSTKHPGIRVVRVESAAEMYEAATKAFPSMDAAILSAAVADYRPETASDTKIKREATGEMTLHLVPNPDIAASLGVRPRWGR